MEIHLKKGRDGKSTLACVRPDGSRTWAKLHPFFPEHDLTHCAVETVFGFRQAFFGLVQDGWELDRFEQPDGRRGMPREALWAEVMVGLFDQERAIREPKSAATFNEALQLALAGVKVAAFRDVTDAELERVRAIRDEWTGRWRALPPGDTLVVPFPAALPAAP